MQWIPDLDHLSLDAAEIEYSSKGITVDSTMRTTSPRIFAVGDCAATIQLVEKRFELRERVFKTLTQGGVELPFETIQLQPIEVKSQDRRPAASLKEERRVHQ